MTNIPLVIVQKGREFGIVPKSGNCVNNMKIKNYNNNQRLNPNRVTAYHCTNDMCTKYNKKMLMENTLFNI